jgi:hypothetical protein
MNLPEFLPPKETTPPGDSELVVSDKRPEDEPPPFDIEPQFRALIPPLSEEERRQLEANLLAHGCRDTIKVWKPKTPTRPVILDGHNRYEICQRLAVAFKEEVIDLPDRNAALVWILENQLGRRNLTDDQRAALAVTLLEQRARASRKKKAREGGRSGGRGRGKDSPEATPTTELSAPTPRAREQVAAEAKVPERKLRDAAEVKKADPGLFDQVAAGQVPLREAKKTVKELKMRQEPPPAPPPPRYPHSDLLTDWLRAVAGTTLIRNIERGGIAALVAESDKWDRRHVREYILPSLDALAETIARYRKEIERLDVQGGVGQGGDVQGGDVLPDVQGGVTVPVQPTRRVRP